MCTKSRLTLGRLAWHVHKHIMEIPDVLHFGMMILETHCLPRRLKIRRGRERNNQLFNNCHNRDWIIISWIKNNNMFIWSQICHYKTLISNQIEWMKMAQRSRALTALAVKPSSVPRTHSRQLLFSDLLGHLHSHGTHKLTQTHIHTHDKLKIKTPNKPR